VRFLQAGVMLLGAVIYVLLIVFPSLITSDIWWVILAALIGWNILLIVATILSIIDGVRKVRAGKTRELATDAFVVKLVAIPFFLLNFAVLALVIVAGFVMLRGGGIVLLPFGVGLTYLTMIATSVYAWASIARLRRDRVIGTALAVLYSILLLGFVTDIVAGILLFGHSRRRSGTALAVMLLLLGVALAAAPFLLIEGIEWLGLAGVVVTEGVEWFGLAGVVVIVATIVVGLIRNSRLRRRVAEVSPLEDAVAAVEGSIVDNPQSDPGRPERPTEQKTPA
jgi:hypothetical protein